MRNRVLKCTWMLAALLPALAAAQQPPRGIGTWEYSVGGGVRIQDQHLLDYFSSGASTSRFTNSASPGNIMPAVAVRMGYNFSNHWGFSLGGEFATAAGVKYWTPFAAVTLTPNLRAKTSPFITVGNQITRVVGINGRLTHPTWGAHAGVGIRRMINENMALRLEGRVATEHYAELTGRKAAYPATITLGLSVFRGGRRAVPGAVVFMPGRVDTVAYRQRLDTAWVTRVDTVRGVVYVMEPGADQLLLRVQFETDSTIILPLSRPVLDTIATALMADPGSRWDIMGHTDNVGGREHNQVLSQGRAQAVLDYLVSRGVNRSMLEATGWGEDRPVVSNGTEEGRAQNRRVQMRRKPSGAYVVPIP